MALSQQYEGLMLVPWFNRHEWEFVYKLICETNNIDSHKQAQTILDVWKRRTPQLPSGVECTRIILEACLIRETGPNENVNILIAASIMRFMNLCCSYEDKQGTFSRQAKSLNFPEWIINIRHDIAHRFSVPSMELLGCAVDFCFQWIQQNYWKKQLNTLESHAPSNSEVYEYIGHALRLYCQIVSCHYLSNSSFQIIADAEIYNKKLMTHILKFKDMFNIDLNAPVDVVLSYLLQYVNMRSKVSENRKLLVNSVVSSVFSEGLVFAVKVDDQNFDIETATELPKDFVCLWSDLFDFMFNIDGLQQFLEKLLRIINSPANDCFRKVIGLWIAHLLERLLLTKAIQTDSAINKKDLFRKFPNMKNLSPFICHPQNVQIFNTISELKEEVENNPNDCTLLFIEKFLELCKPNSKHIELTETIQTMVNGISDTNITDTESYNEDEQSKHLLNCNVGSLDNDDVSEGSEDTEENCHFVLVKDTSIFENCPLGVLKHQTKNINPWLINQFNL